MVAAPTCITAKREFKTPVVGIMEFI